MIASDAAGPDALWLAEVRDSHKASLALPAVQAAIARGRPLIGGFGMRVETRPLESRALGRAPEACGLRLAA